MKLFILVLVIACAVASAQNNTVNFDTTKTNPQTKSPQDSLLQAFQGAMKDSDEDLKMSQSSLASEEDNRFTRPKKKSKKQIIIQGTSAVDPTTINSVEK